MTNGKSRWMLIRRNRFMNAFRTIKVTVIGNCCWEIKGQNNWTDSQRQKFKAGTRNKTPRIAYIKRVRAANRC